MRDLARLALLLVGVVAVCPLAVHAEKKTVCTITVNSPDEKEAFRRALPADRYRFVELVEHGRPDWLASACRAHVSCDVLVISGHYDGGHEFFSDKVEAQEFLPVDELERVSCSDACPGLFSRLKEVYLFGCNTLNPEARNGAAAEVENTLVRLGRPRAEAERIARSLNSIHGESARDRIRDIFDGVPAIYGFSSVAPVGPTAGAILGRYFQSGGAAEIGSGRANGRLLAAFAPRSLTVTSGLAAGDPRAPHRRDVCEFADERLTPAHKLDFVHRLLDRDVGEVRMFLDRLEDYVASIDGERAEPAVAQALAGIASDGAARERYLDYARNAGRSPIRARMLALAEKLGWLSVAQKRAELIRMIDDDVARNAVDASEVDLVCALNAHGELDGAASELRAAPAEAAAPPTAAMLACLGSAEARERVLQALPEAGVNDVEAVAVYLRHRPVAEPAELRTLTAEIARMANPAAQARALETLAQLGPSDRDSVEALTRLFPAAATSGVQVAIAGVLLRADARALDDPELLSTLRARRHKPGAGTDLVDVLIRRLEARHDSGAS